MQSSCDYLIGVDGGGTKTLVRILHADGRVLIEHNGPGSALRNGAKTAWAVILETITNAFAAVDVTPPPLSRLAAGMGIAGYNVAQWAADFQAQAPVFHTLRLASDATTTLLGAHQGQPGAIIAVGTGTIGVALYPNGSERVVDGWGFPSGDDASGAWMGLRAINHVQHALDGRAVQGTLTNAAIVFCANDTAASPARQHTAREIVLDWLSQADQAAFARLARLVVAHAKDDAAAHAILQAAAAEIELMAQALDPDKQLPLALCGGLATALQSYFSDALQQRLVPAQADSADGALQLLQARPHALSME